MGVCVQNHIYIYIYIYIYVCIYNFALNNLQGLICCKTQPINRQQKYFISVCKQMIIMYN